MNYRSQVLLVGVVSMFFIFGIYSVSAAIQGMELEGRYWLADLTAKGKVTQSGIGTDIDFKTDLGLEGKDFPEGRFSWPLGHKSKLRLAYIEIDYSGDKNVERTIEFSGQNYTVTSRVISNLEMKYLRFGWIHQLVNIPTSQLKLSMLLEAKGFWLDMSLAAPELIPAISESKEFTIGVPTLGFALDISPYGMPHIFAEISGISASDYGYFFDAEAGIKIVSTGYLNLLGGWRIFDIEAKDKPDYAALKISGPFVGATFRF